MKITLFFLHIFLVSSIYAHEVPLAKYNLHYQDGIINLTMEFEKSDMKAALREEGKISKRAKKAETHQAIQAYIHSNLSWLINDKIIETVIEEVTEDRHHYFIRATLSDFGDSIKTVAIKNTCLIHIAGHSNIIYAHYEGKTRGFRMHKDRIKTFIDYSGF